MKRIFFLSKLEFCVMYNQLDNDNDIQANQNASSRCQAGYERIKGRWWFGLAQYSVPILVAMLVGYFALVDKVNSIQARMDGLNSNVLLIGWNLANVQIALPSLNASVQDLNATVTSLDLPALSSNVSSLEIRTQALNQTLNDILNQTGELHDEVISLNQTAIEAIANLSMYNSSTWTSLLNWSQAFESSMNQDLVDWRNNLSPVWISPWVAVFSTTVTMSKSVSLNISKFTPLHCGTAIFNYQFGWSCSTPCSNGVRLRFLNPRIPQNITLLTVFFSPTQTLTQRDTVWVPLVNSTTLFWADVVGTFTLTLYLTGCLLT